jgi:uncharacterized protein (DUF4415 family)/uncharacterized DUF497 family protein
MPFEWDEEKRESNLAKHRVDFVGAVRIFDTAVLETVEPGKDYREPGSGASAKSTAEFMLSFSLGEEMIVGSLVLVKQVAEKPGRIVRVRAEEAQQMPDRTDYARLDAMTDEEIAQAVAEDPDAAPLDIDWTKARLVLPPGKESVTLRVDRDVLDWFRKQGKGYQTRMNAVLRAYKEAHQKSTP